VSRAPQQPETSNDSGRETLYAAAAGIDNEEGGVDIRECAKKDDAQDVTASFGSGGGPSTRSGGQQAAGASQRVDSSSGLGALLQGPPIRESRFKDWLWKMDRQRADGKPYKP
jgi:hypothetical protein